MQANTTIFLHRKTWIFHRKLYFITPSLVARNKIEKWTEKMALVRKRDKSQRSEPAIFSSAPQAYLALDSKIYSKTVIFPCWSRMSKDRELILHATLLLNAGNKTFDHIEAKCNPNIHFTSKILSFCLALDPKIHSKTANLPCWSRLFMTCLT